MREQEQGRQVIATVGKRTTEVLTFAMSEEMARGSKKGLPTATFLRGALHALVRMSAVVAGNLISPESESNLEQVQARIDRLERNFLQAIQRIMEGEIQALERKRDA